MFEKSAIQEQFPINEKKLWWSYFTRRLISREAALFFFFTISLFAIELSLLSVYGGCCSPVTTKSPIYFYIKFFLSSYKCIIAMIVGLFVLVFWNSYKYANKVMKLFYGELTEIQKQYPINNRLWWIYFLGCFFLKMPIFYLPFFYCTTILVLHVTRIFFLLFFFVSLIYSFVSATIDVDGFYFDVTDCEIIKKSRSAWLGGKSMLLSDIKSIKLDGLLSPFGIYRLKIKSFFNFSQMISGFDHDTAVAFKEFLDKRIEQAKHGKNN